MEGGSKKFKGWGMYGKAFFCMTQISQLVMLHNLFPTASSPFDLVVHQLTIWMLHITQQNIWDAFSKQIPFDNMRCWKYERGKRGGKPILLRRVEKMAWSSDEIYAFGGARFVTLIQGLRQVCDIRWRKSGKFAKQRNINCFFLPENIVNSVSN